MATRTKTTSKAPTIVVVRESFMVEVGGAPIVYRKGEPVDPADPVLQRMSSEHFEPLRFPHPVSVTADPDIRA